MNKMNETNVVNNSESNNSNLPTITIGCPVRNRGKYLPHYLEAIYNLDYPKDKITLFFVINDCKDDTSSILSKFKSDNDNLYHKIKLDEYDLGTPEDARTTSIRNNYTYKALSKLRNYLLFNIRTDYYLSCDSDIMMKPDTLNKLLSHGKDYVAGLICNGYIVSPNNPYKFMNILNRIPFAKSYKHITEYKDGELIPVDFTGAVMLLSKQLIKSGAQFGHGNQGEDQIFCEDVKAKGFQIYCDTSAKCTHLMSEAYLVRYIKGKFEW